MSKHAYLHLKRAFDVVAAAVGLLAVFPLMAAIALALRCTIGSPVLFRQSRPGLGGRMFRIVKFRTMRDEIAPDGKPAPDVERITRVGRFLRATSLDELPELWNVLRGDMSLVGPRPLLPEYLPLYTPLQARRHEVRPGITGLAQVRGRNALPWEEKFTLDVQYVDQQSLALDFGILIATVSQVLRRQGIAHDGHAAMEPYRGRAG